MSRLSLIMVCSKTPSLKLAHLSANLNTEVFRYANSALKMPTKKTLNSAALFFDKQKYQTKSPETELKIHRHKKGVCLSYSPPRPFF